MLTPVPEGALPPRARGFSLIELAVGMVIIALLLGSLLVPLTTQVGQRRTIETQKALEDVKEAVLGFALANGRLPCPALLASNTGMESFCTNGGAGACGAEILVPAAANPGHGRCSSAYGFVPGVALGLASTDARGYGIDAWGSRIRYAVSTANAFAFTATNGMRNTTLSVLAPDLHVCATSTGIAATTCGAATVLTSSAPAVIYSLGPNFATGGVSADEQANLNLDPVFVFRVRSDPGTAGGEFDDIVTWISANVLYSRMVNAGLLP
jgi:prepilin-type N-terminal cleavage/methylation domain-containing protein